MRVFAGITSISSAAERVNSVNTFFTAATASGGRTFSYFFPIAAQVRCIHDSTVVLSAVCFARSPSRSALIAEPIFVPNAVTDDNLLTESVVLIRGNEFSPKWIPPLDLFNETEPGSLRSCRLICRRSHLLRNH